MWGILFTGFLHALTVTFVVDGESASLQDATKVIEQEIYNLLSDEQEIGFQNFTGNWERKNIEELYSRASGDYVITVGPVASDIAKCSHPKRPTFAAFSYFKGKKTVKNLNVITPYFPIDVDLGAFKKLKPHHKAAIYIDCYALAGIEEVKEWGLPIVPVISPDTHKIPSNIDAVYMTPLFGERDWEPLFRELTDAGIPTFSTLSNGYIEKGVLASQAPKNFIQRLGRRIAINIQRNMHGEKLVDLPTTLLEEKNLTLNVQVAERLNFSPSWEVLLEANLFGKKLDEGRQISLLEAILEGLKQNIHLKSSYHGTLASYEEILKAKSFLLPQINLSTEARQISRDRARVSGGADPEYAIFGRATASQILYSNELWGNYSVQKALHCARVLQHEATTLDTTLQVIKAYLEQLKAKTVEEIHLNNLHLTSSNLETANKRFKAGVANKSEVHRWKSEIATRRNELVKAHFNASSASVSLNELLNIPQTETLSLEKICLNNSLRVMQRPWLTKLIGNQQALDKFAHLAVRDGQQHSPELKQINSLMRARAEELGIARRAFWTPDLSFNAGFSHILERGNIPSASPLNRSAWSAGISLSFPLYSGNEKFAKNRQACQALTQLRYEQLALKQAIEKNIRLQINQTSASFAAIDLSTQSAQAAQQNLDLILDSYSKGVVSILDLLDAQNQSLNANLIAINAVYGFLEDMFVLQRALGRFDFFMTQDERETLYQEMELAIQ